MDGKAVVISNKKAVEVEFVNLSGERISVSSALDEKAVGALVIFNAFEKIIRTSSHDSTREKLIDGLTSEISLSYSMGWRNFYFCSFKKFNDSTAFDLPGEFTTLEEDEFYFSTQMKKMCDSINSHKPCLKKIRLVGIVSEKELNDTLKKLDGEGIAVETDSLYLVIV